MLHPSSPRSVARRPLPPSLPGAALALLLAACPAAPTPPPVPAPAARPAYAPEAGLPGAVHAEFELPSERPMPFFASPWPSELRRDAAGRLELAGYPGGDGLFTGPIVRRAQGQLDGFSVVPVIYFRFSGDVGTSALPSPAESRKPSSPVQLVDVDPESPHRGEAVPLVHRYHSASLRYVPGRMLALTPVPGFVLRPGTLYAAVVRRSLGDAGGALLGTTRAFELTKWTAPRQDRAEERARALHATALDVLETRGVNRDAVAALAVFRTMVPHTAMEKVPALLDALPEAHRPALLDAAWVDGLSRRGDDGYRVLQGYYCTPSFQRDVDRAPFLDEGGTIELGPDGAPLVAPVPAGSAYHRAACGARLAARFILTVPNRPPPPGGYPLLVVSHGTTGDATSFLGQGDFAGWAAQLGMAAVGTDQPLHGGRDPRGARPGADRPFQLRLGPFPIPLPIEGHGSELAFYNPFRPDVVRDNLRQAAIDAMALSRLVLRTPWSTARAQDGAPVLAAGAPPLVFDAARVLVAGHSQGSQSMAVVGAVDPLVRGVVLSGCGGDVRVGTLGRRDMATVRQAVELAIRVEPTELDLFHPLMTLLQTTLDPIDPQSYGRLYHERLPGLSPRSVLHFSGITDSMVVADTAEALAVALRAAPLTPSQREVGGLSLLGIRPAATVAGNAADGQATIALAQFASTRGEDGHFVLYYERPAWELALQFMRGVLAGGAPRLGPIGSSP